MAIKITAVIFTLIGLALAIGGGQLLMLGGSAYYLVCGLAFVLTAVLLFLRKRAALHVYAAIILVSLVWAIWEVGFDWWQLGPRGGVIIVLGIWLLTPWIRRPLGFLSPSGMRYSASAVPLAITVVLSVAIAILSMFFDPYDQDGELPTQSVAAAPPLGGDVPPGEWHQYGRTPYGQRYSPLDQIKRDNFGSLKVAWRWKSADGFLSRRLSLCRRVRRMLPTLVAVDFYRQGDARGVVDKLNGVG